MDSLPNTLQLNASQLNKPNHTSEESREFGIILAEFVDIGLLSEVIIFIYFYHFLLVILH